MSDQAVTVYGIANCDTVRKARKWLEANSISYNFQDVREQPLQLEQLQGWAEQVGWSSLFNKRSTSYRGLDDNTKATLDEASALSLILEYPTLMKRPILQQGKELIVGFSDKTYQPLAGV